MQYVAVKYMLYGSKRVAVAMMSPDDMDCTNSGTTKPSAPQAPKQRVCDVPDTASLFKAPCKGAFDELLGGSQVYIELVGLYGYCT